MEKITTMTSKLFKGDKRLSQDEADKWASKFLREEKRSDWTDENGDFNVEVVVVVKEEVK